MIGCAPPAVPRAPRARPVAGRGPPGPAQQLGGDLLRLRPRPAGRDGPRGAGAGDRAVRARRRLVRRPERRPPRPRRLDRSTARSCPTASTGWPRRSTASACSSACGSSPRWSTRTATCSGRTPTGRSASRAAARTESRQQLVLDLAQPGWWTTSRTPSARPRLRPHRLREVGLEPLRDRAVDAGRPRRPPGRVLPPLRAGPVRPVRAADDALPAHPVRVLRQRRRRFDAGMLAWAPQAWTSDDTDAVERLAIQWGSSIAYPLSSMAAHVSAIPNHQTGRITPIGFRAAVAMFGAFGYELDPTPSRTTSATRSAAGRVLRGAARPVPARAVRAAAQPVRGRPATRRRGWCRRRTASGPSRRTIASSTARSPCGTGSGCAGWTRLPGMRSPPGPVRPPAGTFVRGGDELMRVGIGIEPPDPLPRRRRATRRDPDRPRRLHVPSVRPARV